MKTVEGWITAALWWGPILLQKNYCEGKKFAKEKYFSRGFRYIVFLVIVTSYDSVDLTLLVGFIRILFFGSVKPRKMTFKTTPVRICIILILQLLLSSPNFSVPFQQNIYLFIFIYIDNEYVLTFYWTRYVRRPESTPPCLHPITWHHNFWNFSSNSRRRNIMKKPINKLIFLSRYCCKFNIEKFYTLMAFQ